MATFTFKFQSILKLKEQVEKNIKNELALAMELLNAEVKKLNEIVKKKQETIDEMKRESAKITIWKLKEYSAFIEVMKNKIDIQKNIVNQLQENVDITKRRLVEAMKERKIFEKLKELKKEEHVIEEKRKDLIAVDEIVSYKENVKETKDEG